MALTDKTEDGKDIGILPDFIKYNDHSLDISKGTCLVSFAITVEGVDRTPTPPVAESVKEKVNAALGEEDSDEAEITNDEESAKVDDEESSQKSTNAEASSQPAPSTFKVQVIVTFDASLQKQSLAFNAATSYPFFKPKAILTSGAEHFTASKIENGNELVIDCDWTPSLHLNDAAMNIALKVRESIKRGEPCLKVVVEKKTLKHVEEDLLEEVKADISKAGAKVSSFFSDLKSRASAVADEMDKAVGSGASTSNAATGTGTDTPNKPKRNTLKFPRKERAPKPPSKVVSIENISIGDEIDLAMEPWNKAVGMYPCKAIRRPAFVASAMEAAGQDSREKVRRVEDEETLDEHRIDIARGYNEDCTANNYLMLHSGGLSEVGMSKYYLITLHNRFLSFSIVNFVHRLPLLDYQVQVHCSDRLQNQQKAPSKNHF